MDRHFYRRDPLLAGPDGEFPNWGSHADRAPSARKPHRGRIAEADLVGQDEQPFEGDRLAHNPAHIDHSHGCPAFSPSIVLVVVDTVTWPLATREHAADGHLLGPCWTGAARAVGERVRLHAIGASEPCVRRWLPGHAASHAGDGRRDPQRREPPVLLRPGRARGRPRWPQRPWGALGRARGWRGAGRPGRAARRPPRASRFSLHRGACRPCSSGGHSLRPP
jgi:hypothetical protein